MIGGMGKAIAIDGGATMTLQPGAMVRLNDIDNLRALATKKGLILQTGNNGRRGVKILWKGASKSSAKAAGAAAKVSSAQAKALAASAKSMAASADTLAKAAQSLSAPATGAAAKGAAVGAAKAAGAGTIWTGSGMSLGLGLGLGALGPVVLVGALAASAGGIYAYLRSRPFVDEAQY